MESIKDIFDKIWKIALIGAALPIFAVPYIQKNYGYGFNVAVIITEFAYAFIAYKISTKYKKVQVQ